MVDGFTPEQRFFLSYAGVWAGNVRDEQIRLQTKSDPHSLGRWRVNGALPQIGAWYEAFNITENDPMYLAPEKRVGLEFHKFNRKTVKLGIYPLRWIFFLLI